MDSPNTSAAEPSARVAPAPSAAAGGTSIAWAGSALFATVMVGIVAKTFGVLVTPGLRGIGSEAAMETTEIISATITFTFAALLVALICGGSFELARVRKIGVVSRGSVVAISGLVVALASPAVVMRLQPLAALVLSLVASTIAIIAGIQTARVAHTRIIGATLALVALSGLLRPIAWSISLYAGDQASLFLYQAARALATVAVAVQVLSRVLAAAWLGTRSPWRGRLLANAAIIVAFAITYFALRETADPPSEIAAVLRGSLAQSTGTPVPYGLQSIAAFLVPCTILLSIVAIVQRAQPPAVLASLALALLSSGAFDVPLQALAVTAAAQWAMLAMADDRSVWSARVQERSAAQPAPAE